MDESPFSEIGGHHEMVPRGSFLNCPPISEKSREGFLALHLKENRSTEAE
jgi:hypothetical protein